MSQKLENTPSNQEIGARVVRNIGRARGFLDTLLTEIENPEKTGPRASREELRTQTEALMASLIQLEEILKSKSWDEKHD